MIWSLLRGVIILLSAGLIAYGATYLNTIPGGLVVSINEKEVRISFVSGALLFIAGFLFFWLLLYFLGLCVAVLKFLSGDETALSRYLDRSRQAKGYKALFDAMIAISEDDKLKAKAQSNRANKLLKNNQLSTLISAQVAKDTGEHKKAIYHYKRLMKNKATRLTALNGIIDLKIEAGEQDVALTIARKAYEKHPKNLNLVDKLFKLQLEEEDWSGARGTLIKRQRLHKLPKEILIRRESVLLFAEAREERNLGKIERAISLSLEAVRLSPGFAPALCFLTELENLSGNKARIEKLLKRGWASCQHPDIASAFASLFPKETASQRFNRFEKFIKGTKSNFQSKLLRSELYIALDDFPAARREIGSLIEDEPDNRVLTIMAAIEKGLGSTDTVVRGWLAKAISSRRTFEWICGSCGTQGGWEPVCKNCKGFDSYEWKRPHDSSERLDTSVMLPVLLKTEEDNKLVNVENSREESDRVNNQANLESKENSNIRGEASKAPAQKAKVLKKKKKQPIDEEIAVKSAREII